MWFMILMKTIDSRRDSCDFVAEKKIMDFILRWFVINMLELNRHAFYKQQLFIQCVRPLFEKYFYVFSSKQYFIFYLYKILTGCNLFYSIINDMIKEINEKIYLSNQILFTLIRLKDKIIIKTVFWKVFFLLIF